MEQIIYKLTVESICLGLDKVFLLNKKKLGTLASAFAREDHFFRAEELFPMKVINMPVKEQQQISETYLQHVFEMYQLLCEEKGETKEFVQKLLGYLEKYWSFISVEGHKASVADEVKLEAALALIHYHAQFEKMNHPTEMKSENDVLVCSIDFLGIKDFKFQQNYEEKLKWVIGASVFIELFREYVADTLFELLKLNRSCLIFSGGRHLHILLPNTKQVKRRLEEFFDEINKWLYTCVDEKLSISYGFSEVSKDYDAICSEDMYTRIFTEIADMKEKMQIQPFSLESLQYIENELKLGNIEKKQAQFVDQIRTFSKYVYNNCVYVITEKKGQVPIAPKYWVSAVTMEELDLISSIQKIYIQKEIEIQTKSIPVTKIWLGRFPYGKTYDSLCENEEKIGILRIDVDDFKSKMLLEIKQSIDGRALSHAKLGLSRQFCIFLRYYVTWWMQRNHLDVFLLHEGADDAFYIGSWKELEIFVERLSKLYCEYTGNEITFSGGMCMYSGKNLMDAANQAQRLMDYAKTCDGKNSLAAKNENRVFVRRLVQSDGTTGNWTETSMWQNQKEVVEDCLLPKPAYFGKAFYGKPLKEQKARRKKKAVPLNKLEEFLQGCHVISKENMKNDSDSFVMVLKDLPFVGDIAETCDLIDGAGYYLKKKQGLYLAQGSCFKMEHYRVYCQLIGETPSYIGFYESK